MNRPYSNLFAALFFFSSRRRHTRLQGDWSSDVCSSDLVRGGCDPGPVGRGRSGGRGPAHAAGAAGMNDTIDVTVNGERRAVARGATLLELLRTLELDPRVVRSEERRVGKEGRSRWAPDH